MRTKQAFMNVLFSLLLQVVTAISGLLVPRFFIEVYGSAVNGLVSSISQFITYMNLVEAGVGVAGMVALYKPLANKDVEKINGVLSATRVFYLRSGVIFAGLVVLLTAFYPYLVNNQIQDLEFVRLMIIVLSINGIIDYFFLGKYRVLLMADQHGYILYAIQIVGTVLTIILSLWQISIGCSALLVKGTAAMIFLFRSFAAIVYCKVRYREYKFNGPPAKEAFTQRNAALLHQIVGAVANNAAVVLLTVMLKNDDALSEVSVYTVYNLVAVSLITLITSVSTGITPGFGEVISKGETDTLKRSYSSYELIMFLLVFSCYTCMAVLLYPFVCVYSMQFTDGVNYVRPALVVVFTLAGVLQSVRQPGLTLISAAGHYKETQGRAIIELLISLTFSLTLTPRFGVLGVMIAMCLSYLYRTLDIIIYSAKHFLNGTLKKTFSRLLRNGLVMLALVGIGVWVLPQTTDSWLVWLVNAVLIGIGSVVAFGVVNFIFEKEEFAKIIDMVKGMFLKNKE